MHEMSICEGILLTLEKEAQQQNFQQVKKVWLEIGAFAGVEIPALEFGWEVVTRDSIAAQSELIIETVEAQAWCLDCAQTVTIQNRYDACPSCGSHLLQVTAGEELKIKEIEVA